ncbi:hypothetical protein SERLA73DRAFT_184139 [Serpula lacrymans var. lacrymans S7.3]|uniref:Uncharacterized protein n=2 Tax=Serpula lacrymans var. lacrymans TaxID=341189 RepID=F8Q2M2_SERL3|nr:uncharacterized protein SERLADRAFT_471662 [Serpula lacrymans var. lacrymans S7.9]EGN97433.1 hypothetical protein SERLA73DRAFT_184139 [Serpula lacrymans var. lacrymans S7.3]EGO23024.1 hypothetical protein SERLADRAFT_471662 [Serpula lacrymans var. lacrymans S7.9]
MKGSHDVDYVPLIAVVVQYIAGQLRDKILVALNQRGFSKFKLTRSHKLIRVLPQS